MLIFLVLVGSFTLAVVRLPGNPAENYSLHDSSQALHASVLADGRIEKVHDLSRSTATEVAVSQQRSLSARKQKTTATLPTDGQESVSFSQGDSVISTGSTPDVYDKPRMF